MTPKQRVKTAMALGLPDRVPLMCQLSIGHMLLQLQLSPAELWFDPVIFREGLLRLRESYDFDGILVSLHGHDPHWRAQVQARRLTAEAEEILWKNGDKTICPFDDLPYTIPAHERARPQVTELAPGELPAELGYIPVSQNLRFKIDPAHVLSPLPELIAAAGGRFSIHGEITSPFDYLLDYFGLQEALLALIQAPQQCRLVLAHFAALIEKLALRLCTTGIDAIKISSPFAGAGFISPAFYAQFVLPYEGQIVASIKRQGVHVYLHTCGAIGDRLELMLSSGTSGLECLDPPPLGNVELEEAKRITRGKCFIKGNIDSVNSLLLGDSQAILADARRRLEIGKDGGGFVLSTACSIAPHVAREKILLLREVVEKWG
jgi:hypothetical protein